MKKNLTIFSIVFGIAFISSTIPNQFLKNSIKSGEEVYVLYCQNCHLGDGKGMPGVNPPLAKADYLKKPSKILINVILKGQSGEVVVNGKKYNFSMPAQDYLTDPQIADVHNYINNTWGNKIPVEVSPAMVKNLRK